MGTYLQLKQRVITTCGNDMLEDEYLSRMEEHIADAIENYAPKRFWFNTIRTTLTTVADTENATPAAGVRIIERLAGLYGDLQPVWIKDIPSTEGSSYPTKYALYDGDVYFDPKPDDAYDFTLYGIAQVDAPVADSDTNIWTTEAARLIALHASMTLMQGELEDPQRAGELSPLRANEEARLLSETRRREGNLLRARLVDNAGVPIMARQRY